MPDGTEDISGSALIRLYRKVTSEMQLSSEDANSSWSEEVLRRMQEEMVRNPEVYGGLILNASDPIRMVSYLEAEARQRPSEAKQEDGATEITHRLRKIANNAIAEGANTLFFIIFLAGARWLVEHLFGQSKFFDYVPVRYLFDVGDIAVIGRFIWNTLKGGD